jgi:hypothetical protein
MKFKYNLVYSSAQEVESMLFNGDYDLSCLVVDATLENIATKKKVIPIVSIYATNEDVIFDLALDREDIEKTLTENISIMERFEDYERCQKIVDGLKFITNKKQKNNGHKTKTTSK